MINRPIFKGRASLIVLSVIVLASLFYNLGDIPLFDEDEGAYAEVTLEMLHSGDMVTPRLGGEPFFHKPPMIYWTQAVSVALLGPSEFAFRLPSVLASLAWALLLFGFVRRQMDREAAGFTVFFLVSTIQINVVTRGALADAMLNLFITLTMFAIYAYFKNPRKRYIIIAFAGMALGFMTKGPIAIVIPFVVSFIFFLIQGNLKTWIQGIVHPLGWLVFLAIALPWYLVLIHRFGWHFIEEIFLVHNVGRFHSAMEGHTGPVIYYIPVILLGMLPFTTVLVRAVASIGQHLKNPWLRFLWIWFGFVFIFFSIADTKLQHYIIYGYVPLLILMADSVGRLKRTWLLVLPAVLFMVPMLFLKNIAVWSLPHIGDEFSRIVVQSALENIAALHCVIMGIGLAALVTLAAIPKLSVQLRILALGCLFIAVTTGHIAPMVADIMQGPVKRAALIAKSRDYDVIMWRMNYPSFHVYYGKPARRAKQLSPGDIFITKADKLDQIAPHDIIYQQHGIVLAKIQPVL
jgi:4-amino-4-deoxy-L-arabinose transferase-like glycosyltransferase